MTLKLQTTSCKDERPLLAYICETNDPEDSQVIFAKSNGAAKFPYARSVGTDFTDVTVRRANHFDRWAPGPVPVSAYLDAGWFFECSHCARTICYNQDIWIEEATEEDISGLAEHNARVRKDLKLWDERHPAPAAPLPGSGRAAQWAQQRLIEDHRQERYRISSQILPRLLSRTALRLYPQAVFCNAQCEQEEAERIATINLKHAEAEAEAARRWPGHGRYESKRYPYLEPGVNFRPEGFEYDVHWRVNDDHVYVAGADTARWNRLYPGPKGSENGQTQAA